MALEADPIDRRSLHDRLADRLREAIVEGDLAPEAKINERALCDAFGVSRTPLREALKVLAREGLVVLTPNRGASVAPLTLADLEEAFPIMGALEGVAGELACARITGEELVAIEALHGQMAEARADGDLKQFFALNRRIHDAILAAARNPTLDALVRSLDGRVRRARYRGPLSAARWDRAMAEHSEMLAALSDRDGAKLASILRRHLAGKLETARAALSTPERTPT